jgi:hypothetical protein
MEVNGYFGRTGMGITSVEGSDPKAPEDPTPAAAVVCNNCSARSNNDKLELGGGYAPELGSQASNRAPQCWHTTCLPRYCTRTCKFRPQVGHS